MRDGVGAADPVADCDPVGDVDREAETLSEVLTLGVVVVLDESDCEAVADTLVVPVDESVDACEPERVAETEGNSDGVVEGESVELADWDKVEVTYSEGVADALAVAHCVTLLVKDCEDVADTLGDIEALGVGEREGDDEVEPVLTWVAVGDAESVDEALGDADAEGVSVTLGVGFCDTDWLSLGVVSCERVAEKLGELLAS